MPPVALDSTPFNGRSRSFTTLPRTAGSWPTCERCGNSLYGRLERVRERTIGGKRMSVQLFRCRCRKGQEIRREVAA